MTIHLPNDVERDILAQVQRGQFASVDAALTEAWREFQRHRQAQQPYARSRPDSGLGSIGAMHGDSDLLQQITQSIMHSRETRTLRLPPDE